MTYASIGIAVALIATLGSLLILKRKANDQPKQVKIVLFGLYFWGLIFLLLIVCAIAYSVMGT